MSRTMILIAVNIFLLYTVSVNSQCANSEGPCDGVMLLCPTQVCDTVAGECCPSTTAAAAATTAVGATAATSVTGVTSVTSATGTVTSSTTTNTSCVDRLNPSTGVSDCPALSYLCNDATYLAVMTQQCPRTCGRCNTTSTNSTSGNCTDLLNPSTGVSDCPARASLCNDSVYYDVMTVQCPRTCGRCNGTSTSSSTTSATTTCADLINPATGVSDCPSRVAYCTNPAYITLMQTQCRLTCGFCTSG